ncbi:MAG: hypothetical protein M3P93_17945 [Actinomycetota bacterium]|nr:hypothetical protein [Actinomycetota bacterium]
MTPVATPPFTAHLRVYEPLAAFEGAERARWSAYAASGRAPDRMHGLARERAAALRALATLPPGLPPEQDEAFVLEVDGVTLLSPWCTRVRAAQALAEFAGQVHEELLDAFVPRAVAAAAQDELEAWRRDVPAARAHALTSPWQVPLRWFVLVDAEERSVRLGEGSVRTGRELVYRTAMSRARRRLARGLAVLRRALDDATVVEAVEDLGRWLEEFHPRSLVELDYGGLVHLLDDAELVQDESARDVSEALQALSEGDAERSGAAYARVSARMKALQATEAAN